MPGETNRAPVRQSAPGPMHPPLKIAVTGAAGLFGAGMVRTFSREHKVLGLTRQDADIRDVARLRERLSGFAPDVLVHPAGMPSPDVCEQNPQLAFDVNVGGTEAVTKVAYELGAAVVLISSDAVFDGRKSSPYTEEDVPNPISVYGETKFMAESVVQRIEQHFIFRVSVLFGHDKANFVSNVLAAIRQGRETVVALDQIGSATYVDDAAGKILEVVQSRAYGIFHLSNEGACSRYELACEAARFAGVDASMVKGVALAEMKRPGPRVAYSVMAMEALVSRGLRVPRNWREALSYYIGLLRTR